METKERTTLDKPAPEPTTGQPLTDPVILKTEVARRIKECIKHYRRWSKFWTTVNSIFLYLSILTSAAAALVLKLDGLKDRTMFGLSQSDLAAILAGVAAICSTLIASGGFSRKWRANLIARREAEQLEIDLETSNLNEIRALQTRLKHIIQKQNEGILGPE